MQLKDKYVASVLNEGYDTLSVSVKHEFIKFSFSKPMYNILCLLTIAVRVETRYGEQNDV